MEEQRRPIGRLFFDHNPNHNSDHNHEVRVTYYPSISTFLGCLAIVRSLQHGESFTKSYQLCLVGLRHSLAK
uniref:Uncharacterized protein n=1 Tax=Candidatus Kentrum sp. FW TaxID=2126338 RepID=A0A450RZR6_9GAMM|nr:MAG: hypothetical protein BECKFW1821A_GA0114235_100822 [Candidatus Kentron sp. FW]